MRLIDVVIDIQSSALNKPFTYVCDEGEIGCMVLVPFGHSYKCGFIVDVYEGEAHGLKQAVKVLSEPYFDKQSVEFAKYISDRYLSSLASTIRLFLPPGSVPKCKKVDGEWKLEESKVSTVQDRYISKGEKFEEFIPKPNAIKQKEIMEVLRSGEVKYSDLTSEYGSISQTIKSLEKSGAIKVVQQRRYRGEAAEAKRDFKIDKLTEGQRNALDLIKDNQFVLIDGVTGSGKTEVYLQAIEDKSAIVLVPEISLTPQTVARFRSRFGDKVSVLHSKMSAGERYDQWDLIRSGKSRVVVGARSALFAPVKNLGIIIIDEEHETSYKQDTNPKYVTPDCAMWLAKKNNAKLILGSATPSLESLCNKNFKRAYMPERTNKMPMPNIEVVNMGNEFKSGSTSLFSKKLTQALNETFERGQKAVLMYNRRGFASYMFCRECGYIPQCKHCSTSLTYHSRFELEGQVLEMLSCHHCGYLEHVTNTCPKCNSPYYAKLGAGTESVEDQLHELFPDVNIVRMDADTTRKKGGHQKCLEQFAIPGPSVLLGTQMIAKGLDFDDVTLVGVVLADVNLNMPDFRSEEQTFDLICQVAGRAGRADKPGRVIVQTYSPENPSIACATTYDRNSFLTLQLQKRQLLNYPPFSRLTNIVVSGYDEDFVKKCANELYEHLLSIDKPWELSPASQCLLGKVRSKFRYHITIKSPMDYNVSEVLGTALSTFKTHKGINISVDIDALSLY